VLLGTVALVAGVGENRLDVSLEVDRRRSERSEREASYHGTASERRAKARRGGSKWEHQNGGQIAEKCPRDVKTQSARERQMLI
jgi:hypothetical protein